MKKTKFYLLFLTTLTLVSFTACSSSSENMEKQSSNDKFKDMPPPPNGEFPPPPPPGGFAKNGFPPGPPPNGFSSKPKVGEAKYIIKDGQTLENKLFESTSKDENVLQTKGDTTASLENVVVKKTSGKATSNDASSFYGVNSAILALDDSKLSINNSTIIANAQGATGVFAYGNSTIDINNSKIEVTGGNAGGIEVAGGGKINAKNLTINSSVKAAIRSDRGGGKIVVDGGTYTTKGSTGAPAVYSTANITVKNATLTSNDSEAVVIEGLNSVTIINSQVTGNMRKSKNEDNINLHNVMLYQSMSGDSQIGTSVFTMKGGTLTSKSGDMFYVTNTSSVINLDDVKLNQASNSYILKVSGNNNTRGWGRKGYNGGTCEFNLSNQTLEGNILVDSISKLDMNISNNSIFKGAINQNASKALALSVKIDNSSKWILTDDSFIKSLESKKENIILNGHKLYVNGVLYK